MTNKILIIEDDDIARFIIRRILVEYGETAIDEASDGLEGLTYLEEACPELILLDLNMTVMDGWSFLEELDKRGVCPHTKVAILTSSDRSVDKQKAQKFDSVIQYLEKPLNSAKLDLLFGALRASEVE